jgi:hypothetical protein
MKITGWIFALILFIAVLYLQLCRTKSAGDVVPKSDYEALKKKTDDTVHYFNELLMADSAHMENATALAIQANEKAEQSEAKLTESQSLVQRLNNKIMAAKKEKPDSAFIAVSPNYIDGCDSLQLASEYQDRQIDTYKQEKKELIQAKQAEIATRDKTIKDQKQFNAALQKQLDTCQLKVKEKEEPIKKKAEFYGGVGMLGNKTNPIGGGEVGFALKTKKDKIYEIKYIQTNKDWWAGVKTFFKIF